MTKKRGLTAYRPPGWAIDTEKGKTTKREREGNGDRRQGTGGRVVTWATTKVYSKLRGDDGGGEHGEGETGR